MNGLVLKMTICAASSIFLGLLGGCRPPPPFDTGDIEAIQALQQEYAAAWLRDDTTSVLATLEPDAVIIPAGFEPIQGHDAIQAYWWPDDGSRTTIHDYTERLEVVDGDGDTAFSRGRAAITFTYEKDGEVSTQTSSTIALTVYRRQPGGRWRIAQRMWSQTEMAD